MLILTRKPLERIRLKVGGTHIWISVEDVDRNKVKLGISAPFAVEIMREELLEPPTDLLREIDAGGGL